MIIFYFGVQVDFKLPILLWRTNRKDFFAWLGTFIICLAIGVELGLLFGILLDMSTLLYVWARPNTNRSIEFINNRGFIRIVPSVGMFYPGVDSLRERVNRSAVSVNYQMPLVIDCSQFIGLDYTSSQVKIFVFKQTHVTVNLFKKQ